MATGLALFFWKQAAWFQEWKGGTISSRGNIITAEYPKRQRLPADKTVTLKRKSKEKISFPEGNARHQLRSYVQCGRGHEKRLLRHTRMEPGDLPASTR